MNKTANDIQIAGDHYKTSYQHWDMLVSLGFGSEYYIGQATKYITRWRKKNGIRDLRKGQHFVQKLIELVDKHGKGFLVFGRRTDWDISNLIVKHADSHLRQYFKENEVGNHEQAICICIMFANSTTPLHTAISEIEALVQEAAALEQKTDVEVPVSIDYDFIEYTDHDTIRWRKKATGEEQDLPLTTPPMLAQWAAPMS